MQFSLIALVAALAATAATSPVVAVRAIDKSHLAAAKAKVEYKSESLNLMLSFTTLHYTILPYPPPSNSYLRLFEHESR